MTIKPTRSTTLAELNDLAVSAFGSKLEADKWLNEYHPILGGSPVEIAQSLTGAIEVKKILSAIIYGGVV